MNNQLTNILICLHCFSSSFDLQYVAGDKFDKLTGRCALVILIINRMEHSLYMEKLSHIPLKLVVYGNSYTTRPSDLWYMKFLIPLI